MDAKAYVKQYRDRVKSGEVEHSVVADIQSQYLDEAGSLFKTKQVKNDLVLIQILKEQDLKWRAMSRLEKRIKPDGFVYGIFSVIPGMFIAMFDSGFSDFLKKEFSESGR